MLEDDPFDDGVSGIVPCPCTAKSSKGNGTPSLGGNCGMVVGFFGQQKWATKKPPRVFLVRLDICLEIPSFCEIGYFLGDFVRPRICEAASNGDISGRQRTSVGSTNPS